MVPKVHRRLDVEQFLKKVLNAAAPEIELGAEVIEMNRLVGVLSNEFLSLPKAPVSLRQTRLGR